MNYVSADPDVPHLAQANDNDHTKRAGLAK